MADFILHRRNLLKAGALSSLALLATRSASVAAGLSHDGGGSTSGLAAWIRTGPDGRILISIGEARDAAPGEWHTAGTIEAPPAPEAADFAPQLALTSFAARREAHAYARDLLVEVAARAWTVPQSECETRGLRIVHEASGRQIPYRLWMTL